MFAFTWNRDARTLTNEITPQGVQSHFGWERLAKLLDEHESRGHERIESITVTHTGLTLVFGRKG
jgi:hypothetical protein